MNRKKVIIIVIVVVVIIIAVAAYLIYKNFKPTVVDENKEEEENIDENKDKNTYIAPVVVSDKPANILDFQKFANSKGYTPRLVEDDKWGPKTAAAWSSLKNDYNKRTITGQPQPVTPGGFTSGQRIFLKGNVANIYSYPQFSNSYIVGSLEKSFFLDKPIGQYISPATGGFAKIKVFGFKPYGSTQYKVETRDVYISTQSISKTAF